MKRRNRKRFKWQRNLFEIIQERSISWNNDLKKFWTMH